MTTGPPLCKHTYRKPRKTQKENTAYFTVIPRKEMSTEATSSLSWTKASSLARFASCLYFDECAFHETFYFQAGILQIVDDEHEEFDLDCRRSPYPRPPSPSPAPPPPSDRFASLSMRDQVAYIRPVLHRIINGSYAPAMWRHDAFIKGGKARTGLAQKAESGKLSHKECAEILAQVRRWILRGERMAEMREDSDGEDIMEIGHIAEIGPTNGHSNGGPTLDAGEQFLVRMLSFWSTLSCLIVNLGAGKTERSRCDGC